MRPDEFEKMDEARIKQEKERLAGIVFEGAPDWAQWAAMDKSGKWFWYETKPFFIKDIVRWIIDIGGIMYSIARPKTTLDWRNTLINRSSDSE